MVADEEGCAILLLHIGDEIEDLVDVVPIREKVAEKHYPIKGPFARLRERGAQCTRVAMHVAEDGDRSHRRDRYQST